MKKQAAASLLCGFDGGRIAALDLVCTGFRPDDAAEHAAAGRAAPQAHPGKDSPRPGV